MADHLALVFGMLSGATVFAGGVWALLRGIFRQVGATEDNTRALNDLTGRVNGMVSQVENHAERISRLEGSRGPAGGPGSPRRRPGR